MNSGVITLLRCFKKKKKAYKTHCCVYQKEVEDAAYNLILDEDPWGIPVCFNLVRHYRLYNQSNSSFDIAWELTSGFALFFSNLISPWLLESWRWEGRVEDSSSGDSDILYSFREELLRDYSIWSIVRFRLISFFFF